MDRLQVKFILACFLELYFTVSLCLQGEQYEHLTSQPTVMVAVLIRNKEHVLPWFFYYLENLDYPKQQMKLWIRVDHCEDKSALMTMEWLSHVESEYSHVDFIDDNPLTGPVYADAVGPLDWSRQRFDHVIQLRQQALDDARRSMVDFLLFVDADSFLTNPLTLKELIGQNRLIIGPMLNNTVSSYYANFWAGMDSNGYYKRTDEYLPILHRHVEGVFAVPMVHSTVLIQLRRSDSQRLSFDPPPPEYAGPVDDIIIFAHSVRYHGLSMHVDNRNFYGYQLVPLTASYSLEDEQNQFIHARLQNIIAETPLQRLPYLEVTEPLATKLGFSEIYMINLLRRPDRRTKMLECFRELGIAANVVNAVDGRVLNETFLVSRGIHLLPGFVDPHRGRLMTMGEIGCFLSHYIVWQEVVVKKYERVIVFEDDVRFQPYFIQKLHHMMNEVDSSGIDWDLIYLGRKRLQPSESLVEGTSTLVWPDYSYWTVGYILSYRGALKLIEQNPLAKLVPVDEYLPIMYDKHPEQRLKEHFSPRDLVVLSANPLLIEPTHYTGQPGYFTDTEDSPTIDDESVKKLKGDPDLLPTSDMDQVSMQKEEL